MNPRNPVLAFLPDRLILALTTFGPLGKLKAPGTWGSVAGILLFTVVFYYLPPVSYLLLTLFFVLVAVPLCGEAEIRLGRRDPGCVILDECVAIPICFFGLPFLGQEAAWAWILGGFLLFRLFDIAKPFGIAKLQNLEGGWGVVVDDVAAAAATNMILQIVCILLK